jgi:phospholipase C
VPYGVSASMDVPNPDAGEEFPHINTQLFGVIDPPGKRGTLCEQMAAVQRASRSARDTDDGRVRR